MPAGSVDTLDQPRRAERNRAAVRGAIEIVRSSPTLREEHDPALPVSDGRLSLRADCDRCFALCCVAPAFSASADFAIDKAAGQPCPNLRQDFRCGIHGQLRERGFPGCTVYDCFGAGQQVSQVTFGGRDWRQNPRIAEPMFQTLTIMRQLHELLWYLTEALTLQPARPLLGELSLALAETERLTRGNPDELLTLDVGAHREGVSALLLRTSELVRAAAGHRRLDRRGADLIGTDLRGADLIGKDLRGADLRGADLRGAYLIGADLTRADLRMADLIGADLRGADLSGADLTGSIFLVQSQLQAARGDGDTRLPPSLTHPAHWPSAATPGQRRRSPRRPRG
jgi:uncharacterized protein YjbI with pentapeptide repeats